MGAKTACHSAAIVQQFIAKNGIKPLLNHSNSLELALAYFFLFLEVKNDAGWQDPDPGHYLKQLGWVHQEAEQRRLRRRHQ